jgi:multiple sugar transport system ATP-binding protein
LAQAKFENLTKKFGEVVAVDNINLEIEDGEFVTLVGPSGCGKSTTLRLLAGLENPTSGSIYIDDKKIDHLPPQKREISMVFQSYALFPHMSVEANIAFGLKIKKESQEEKEKKIKWALKLLGLSGLEKRIPKELSGGQRQRVALGRALVLKPKVLLLDEPLSNLDAKLRLKMRTELKRLHKRIKTTILYVTHDQAEAMTLSDRLAVMKDGKILQLGPPEEIYSKPVDLFTAGFIGSPPMNFLPGELFPFIKEKDIIVGIRPEDWELSLKEMPQGIKGKTTVTETLGSDEYLYIEVSDTLIVTRLKPGTQIKEDIPIWLTVEKEKMHFFDKNTQKNITPQISQKYF